MTVKQYPFFIKATVILIGLFYLVSILNSLSGILIPFAFAVLFSILLNPLFNRLLRYKIPRALAVLGTLLVAISFTVLLFYLLSSQVIQFGQSFPILKIKFNLLVDNLEGWINGQFGISIAKQIQFIKSALNSSQAVIGETIGTVFSTLSVMLLIPIYIFMLLI